MNVNFTGKNFYKSPLLQKGLEFAAKDGSLFIAGTSLALSTFARPLSILAAPKTDKENKKLACTKSIVSSGLGFGIMFLASNPISRAITKIDESPTKYLKPKTIKNMMEKGKPLIESKGYQFATQIFKLGLAFVIAAPKAVLSAALIPIVLNKIFKNNNSTTNIKQKNSKNISFKGGAKLNPISKGIGKIIDKPLTQKIVNKYKNSNYQMHIPVMTDILATSTFVHQNNKNKKIKEERKQILNRNAIISTTLSIFGGYVIDKSLNKPTEKFIKKYSEINKKNPNLGKQIEGIKIVKPALIMGSIYYIGIPLISTFLAERIRQKQK